MRRRTKFFAGNYYHVYNRGANREKIFRENENYLFLLEKVVRYATEMAVTIIAYCLMPNRYHFLLRREGERTISDFIQAVFNSYSKAFNKMYLRTGTLFEGLFQCIHVDKESYLIYLCRYIHRNPLAAGLVADLERWPYSNYLEWIEARAGKLVDRKFVKSYFQTPEQYRSFVLETDDPAGVDKYFLD